MNINSLSAALSDKRNWIYMTAIFLTSCAFLSLGAGQSEGGSVGRQIQWLLFSGSSVWFLLRSDLKIEPVMFNSSMFFFIVFLIYIAVSSIWSVVTAVSFKRAILLYIVIGLCFSVFGQLRQSLPNFINCHIFPIGLLLGISLLVVLLLPSYGKTAIGWRGVMSHKNELGQVATAAVILFSCNSINSHTTRNLICTVISGILLWGAESSSCLIGLIISMSIGFSLFFTRYLLRSKTLSILLLGGVLFFTLVFYVSFLLDLIPTYDAMIEKIFSILGKSSTLTGRTQLWELVLENNRFHQNPWLGGGFGGFWNGVDSIAGYIDSRFGGGYVGQAHNGYIDLYNDLGYIGIGFLVLFLIIFLYRIFSIKNVDVGEFYFHLIFFIFLLILNITESVYFRTTQFLNIVMISSFIRVNTLYTFYLKT